MYSSSRLFHWNPNKEGLAFSERVTGTSRATEIFWKYANYQLVSQFLVALRPFLRSLLPPFHAVHLVETFRPFFPDSLSRFSGLFLSFVRRVRLSLQRTCDNLTPFIFHSFPFERKVWLLFLWGVLKS